MKTPTDHKTQELPTFAVGDPPYFELDEHAPWPMPKAADRTPEAARQRVLEPFKRWLARMATS